MKISEMHVHSNEFTPLAKKFLDTILGYFDSDLTTQDVLICLAAVRVTEAWVIELLDEHGINISYERVEPGTRQ